jgi:hypothetical protein
MLLRCTALFMSWFEADRGRRRFRGWQGLSSASSSVLSSADLLLAPEMGGVTGSGMMVETFVPRRTRFRMPSLSSLSTEKPRF